MLNEKHHEKNSLIEMFRIFYYYVINSILKYHYNFYFYNIFFIFFSKFQINIFSDKFPIIFRYFSDNFIAILSRLSSTKWKLSSNNLDWCMKFHAPEVSKWVVLGPKLAQRIIGNQALNYRKIIVNNNACNDNYYRKNYRMLCPKLSGKLSWTGAQIIGNHFPVLLAYPRAILKTHEKDLK